MHPPALPPPPPPPLRRVAPLHQPGRVAWGAMSASGASLCDTAVRSRAGTRRARVDAPFTQQKEPWTRPRRYDCTVDTVSARSTPVAIDLPDRAAHRPRRVAIRRDSFRLTVPNRHMAAHASPCGSPRSVEALNPLAHRLPASSIALDPQAVQSKPAATSLARPRAMCHKATP